MRFILYLIAITFTVTIAGCGGDGVLNTKDKPKTTAKKSSDTPPPIEKEPTPGFLTAGALLRRVYLDAIGLPPSPNDVKTITDTPEAYADYVTSLTQHHRASQVFADDFPSRLLLDSRSFPDLEILSEQGETSLSPLLTTSGRSTLLSEISYFSRWLTEKRHSSLGLLSSPIVITSDTGLSLWGLEAQGLAFTGSSNKVALYTDGRPDLGILGQPQFMANMSRRGDLKKHHRTQNIFKSLLCTDFEGAKAHDFSSLSLEELSSMDTLMLEKPMCASCHKEISEFSLVTSGLFSGTTLNTWKSYTASPLNEDGYLAGKSYKTLEDAATIIGTDPRLIACQAIAIASSNLGMPRSALPSNLVAKTTERLGQNPEHPLSTARAIYLSDSYKYSPLSTAIKGTHLKESSGIRLLKKHHWASLSSFLAPYASLSLDDGLDPGRDGGFKSQAGIPSGLYFHAVNQFARGLAAAIVNHELQSDVPRINRLVLKVIPDGIPTSISSAVVEAQIIEIWSLLLGEQLPPSHANVQELVSLWTSLNVTSDGTDMKEAWKVMLTGFLTHPAFLVY